MFDPAKNKLFKDGEAIRWVAYNTEGECVGRIAAFYDKTHAYGYEQPTGGCGFFEEEAGILISSVDVEENKEDGSTKITINFTSLNMIH